jgi:hypothetical protein
LVYAIHDFSHSHGDALNHDRRVRLAAEKLEQYLIAGKEKCMNENNDNFGMWGVLELMGHVKMAGFVTEEELFGGKIGRIDIPGEAGQAITQYFGGHTLYRLTPVSEAVARAFAARNRPRPVYVYELALPAPREPGDEVGDDVSDRMDEVGDDVSDRMDW